MKKHILFISVSLLLILSFSFSLALKAQYSYQYKLAPTAGGKGSSIAPTSDGGYILGGYNQWASSTLKDMVLVKTNSNGGVLWSRKYGSSTVNDECVSARETSDGGYILCGTNGVYGSIIKTTSAGTIQWSARPVSSVPRINRVIETYDGGFAYAGYANFGGGYSAHFGKLNSAGTTLWSYETASIPANNSSALSTILETFDKGYFTAGYLYDSTGTGTDNWLALFKTDSNGAMQWTKKYKSGRAYDAVQTPDSGFVVVGDLGGSLMGISKFNKNGDSLWKYITVYGGLVPTPRSIKLTPDGGFIVLVYGSTSSNGQLTKFDSNGGVQWSRQINAGGIEFTFDAEVLVAADGGYVVNGNYNNEGFYLLKSNTAGYIGGCNTSTITPTNSTYNYSAWGAPSYSTSITFNPVTLTSSAESITSTTYCSDIPFSIAITKNDPTCYGMCNGNATAVTTGGSSPFTYSWSNFDNTQTTNGLCNGNYSVTVTDGLGVTKTATVAIVHPANLVASISSNPSGAICAGQCATLTGNVSGGIPPYTYYWTPTASTPTIVVCPPSTTNYQFAVSDANSCGSNTANYSKTVTQLPNGNISPVNPSMCKGSGITLTASGGGSYSWWSPVTSASASISVNPTSTITYSCTATSSGCTKTYTNTVNVLPTPTVSVSASDTLYCVGGSSIITATGANSYVWQPGGQTTSSIFVNASTTITYTVTGTGGNNCTNKKSITITVNPGSPPSVGITPSATSMCEGGNITLTASGANTYYWSPGGQTSVVIVVSPTSTSSYSLTGTVTGGCSGSTSVLLTVNPAPSLSVTASNYSVCAGSNVSMGASGASSYSWYPGGQTTASIVGNPTTNTTYTVTGTGGNGCAASLLIGITANPLPAVSISGNTSICSGATTTLTASGGSTYSWSTGATTTSIQVSPTSTSTYTAYGTDLIGCVGQGFATINIANGNVIPICLVTVDSASKNNIIIWDKPVGTSVDSVIIYREISTNTYQPLGSVSMDSISLFIDTVRTKYFPNTGDPNNGTYRYKIATKDTCGNISAMSPYHNTIFMINNTGTFSWQQLYTIEGSPNPVNNYLLMRDDNSSGVWDTVASVAGTQQQVNDPAYAAYQATASWRISTDWAIACTASVKDPQTEATNLNSSKSNTFKTGTPIAVSGSETGLSIQLYPNPTSGKFNLKMDSFENLKMIRINTIYGERIYQKDNFQISTFSPQGVLRTNLQIDLSTQPAGVYFLRAATTEGVIVRKIIKE